MATSTIVITYTDGTGGKDDIIASYTEGGTAYASLTAAQRLESVHRMEKAIQRVTIDQSIGANSWTNVGFTNNN